MLSAAVAHNRITLQQLPLPLELPATAVPRHPHDSLSHFEHGIFSLVDEIYRRQGRLPVRTESVAAHLDKHSSYVRRFLVQLERKHKIMRIGQRGGWIPVRGGNEKHAN